MRFSIDVGSELELKLYQAVLLYKTCPLTPLRLAALSSGPPPLTLSC
jgi:hypothetical protein